MNIICGKMNDNEISVESVMQTNLVVCDMLTINSALLCAMVLVLATTFFHSECVYWQLVNTAKLLVCAFYCTCQSCCVCRSRICQEDHGE